MIQFVRAEKPGQWRFADAAAVPALIEAAQHPSNVDLPVCATHSLDFKVLITDSAVADLKEIVEFVAQNDSDAAFFAASWY